VSDPTLLVDGTYMLDITTTDANGGTTTQTIALTFDPAQEPDLEFFSGFTPRESDYWKIQGIEKYPSNKVSIYNRWGNLVYETKGYDNASRAWRGEANEGIIIGNKQVPDGTYFYVVDLGDGSKVRSGYVVFMR
ncbi:MAG: gliding motility-associated C-terminal domain-containing protein, partial [Cyclobacteriaceae bacterium]